MKTTIVFSALLAFAMSAEVVKLADVGLEGTVVYSGAFGGLFGSDYVPVFSNVHAPVYRTVYYNQDGTVVDGVSNVVVTGAVPVTNGLQGPSSRTVSVGADGSVVDSLSSGGFVSNDGTVVAPSQSVTYGQNFNRVLVQDIVNPVLPFAKNLVYAPEYYSGYVPFPYAKSIVSGPSGTIVAK